MQHNTNNCFFGNGVVVVVGSVLILAVTDPSPFSMIASSNSSVDGSRGVASERSFDMVEIALSG
jgi:hypothetical protein